MQDLFNLKGKVAVVSGGADGLGFSMITALANYGCDIAIVDVKDGKAAAEKIRELGVHAEAYCCNIADRKQVFELAEKVKADFGKVDVLINNAGVFQEVSAEDMDFEKEWRRIMSVNVDGTFSMCQAFGNMMLEAGSGSIVINASKSGILPDVPNKQAAYNVAKACLIMLTKSLAAEWSARGVRVNAICPGNMVSHADAVHYQPGDAIGEAWLGHIPMRRFGTVDELNGMVVYLASDSSSYTNGAILSIDGGYTAV